MDERADILSPNALRVAVMAATASRGFSLCATFATAEAAEPSLLSSRTELLCEEFVLWLVTSFTGSTEVSVRRLKWKPSLSVGAGIVTPSSSSLALSFRFAPDFRG